MNFEDLLPEVLPDVAGCSEVLALREIRNATIKLCERSLALRYTHPAISLVADEPRYVLTPPASRVIIEVFSAQITTYEPLTQASQDQLDLWWSESRNVFFHDNSDSSPSMGDWRQLTQTIPRVFYIDRSAATYRLRLVGTPVEALADAITAVLVLKPAMAATEIDDWFAEEHFRTIANGALGKLLAIPKKPWSEPELSGYYMTLFERETEASRALGLRDFVRDDESIGRSRAWP